MLPELSNSGGPPAEPGVYLGAIIYLEAIAYNVHICYLKHQARKQLMADCRSFAKIHYLI